MSAIIQIIIRVWPGLVSLGLIFSTWGLWDVHQEKKELQRQITLADKRYQSATDALAERDQAISKAAAERDAARAELAAAPDDGCLDRTLPDSIRRLLRETRRD